MDRAERIALIRERWAVLRARRQAAAVAALEDALAQPAEVPAQQPHNSSLVVKKEEVTVAAPRRRLVSQICRCGHDRAQHADRLPAPCEAGWSLTLQAEAMQAALDESRCPLVALAEETQRQRATNNACECIAFEESAPAPTVTGPQRRALAALAAAPDGLPLAELPTRLGLASMRALRGRGLADYKEGRWRITPAGQEVCKSFAADFPGASCA